MALFANAVWFLLILSTYLDKLGLGWRKCLVASSETAAEQFYALAFTRTNIAANSLSVPLQSH